jgi:hypothetical protein
MPAVTGASGSNGQIDAGFNPPNPASVIIAQDAHRTGPDAFQTRVGDMSAQATEVVVNGEAIKAPTPASATLIH